MKNISKFPFCPAGISAAVSARAIALLAGVGLLCRGVHAGNANLLSTQLPRLSHPAAATPHTALADLNTDERPDLPRAVPGIGGASVGVQFGLGSESFASASTRAYAVAVTPDNEPPPTRSMSRPPVIR
jgi:hypothetical protein